MAEYILRPPAASGGDGYILKAPEKPADPTGSFMENVAAGAGKAVVDAGRGLRQIASNVPLLNRLDALNPEKVQAEIDESRKLDAPLMRTGGGVTGNILGNVAMTAAVPVGGSVGGAAAIGAGLGAVQPVAEGESRLLNTAIGAGAGAAGKVVGDKIGQAVSDRLAKSAADASASQAQNAGRDAALVAGKAEGYVVPRRMVGDQGPLTTVLEGFGGKIKLEQLASNKNAAVTNRLAREELGLAPDAVLNESVLNGIRQQAGRAYEAVSNVPQINATPQYSQAVNGIQQQFMVLQSKFPQLANKDIEPIVQAMSQGSFTGREAVEFVRHMRQSGNLNSNVANTVKNANEVRNLGRAQLAAADAMDDLISQNLASSGNKGLFDAYQQARVTIAKTHTIENAMDNAGNVSARKLLDQLEGKSYGGKLKTAADFAGSFPKAVQDVAKVEPVSVLDTAMATGLGFGVNPAAAAIPMLRPAARSMMLSDLVQGMSGAPRYAPSSGLRLADTIGRNPAVRAAIPGASAAGALTLRDLVQQ